MGCNRHNGRGDGWIPLTLGLLLFTNPIFVLLSVVHVVQLENCSAPNVTHNFHKRSFFDFLLLGPPFTFLHFGLSPARAARSDVSKL